MEVKVKINDKVLKKVLGSLSVKALTKVMNKGLSVAASKARKASLKLIQKEYALKTKEINGLIRMSRPRYGDFSSVTIQARPIGLDKFPVHQGPGGLSVKITNAGGPVNIGSGFLQTVHGRKLAFVRTSQVDKGAKPYVQFPSKAQAHRSNKGAELPINRLLADPVSEVVWPHADDIATKASNEAAIVMLVETDRLLDLGKG